MLLYATPDDHETFCAIDNAYNLADRPAYPRRNLDRASDVTLSRVSTAYGIRSACSLFLAGIRVGRHGRARRRSCVYLSLSATPARNLSEYCPAKASLVGLGIGAVHTLLLDTGMEAVWVV